MSIIDVDILHRALQWKRAHKRVILATVIETWGSAPRKVGSHMAICLDGTFLGSVSGGCVEGAVLREAMQGAWEEGGKTITYGISSAEAWEVGLACGGTLVLWLEEIEEELHPKLHHQTV